MILATHRDQAAVWQHARHVACVVQAHLGIDGVLREHGAGVLISTPVARREIPAAHHDLSHFAERCLLPRLINQDHFVALCAISHRKAVALKDRILAEELPAHRPGLARANAIDQLTVIGEMLLEGLEVTPVRWLSPKANNAEGREFVVVFQRRDELAIGSGDRTVDGCALRGQPRREARNAMRLRVPRGQSCSGQQRQDNVVQRAVDRERKERGQAIVWRQSKTLSVEPEIVQEVAMSL